jgi:hypothetical protein
VEAEHKFWRQRRLVSNNILQLINFRRQAQQILLITLTNATGFGRTDNPQALST